MLILCLIEFTNGLKLDWFSVKIKLAGDKSGFFIFRLQKI